MNKKLELIDWHVHSNISDGYFSPEKIVEIAKNCMIDLSLTDHDSIDGLAKAKAVSEELDFNITNGIELSVNDGGVTLHLLGYGINDEDKKLQDTLRIIQEKRNKAIEDIIKCAHENGEWKDISFETMKYKYNISSYLSKIHLATELVSKGYEGCDNIYDALKFVKRESVSISDPVGPPIKEGIEILLSAGKVISLAHLNELKKSDFEEKRFVSWLKDLGVEAIEAVSSKYDPEQIVRYLKLANEFDMKITIGNDFHGEESTPGIKIGVPIYNLLRKEIMSATGLDEEKIKKKYYLTLIFKINCSN